MTGSHSNKEVADLRSRSEEINRMADAYGKELPRDPRSEELNVLKCLRVAALELHNASIWMQRTIWMQRNEDREAGRP